MAYAERNSGVTWDTRASRTIGSSAQANTGTERRQRPSFPPARAASTTITRHDQRGQREQRPRRRQPVAKSWPAIRMSLGPGLSSQ